MPNIENIMHGELGSVVRAKLNEVIAEANKVSAKVDVVEGKSLSDTNYTQPEKDKLFGIDNEATKNSSDSDLRDRSTHTGTQVAATIIDLPDLLVTKVDVEPGKVLSDVNITQEEKDKLASLEDSHFKGGHIGLAGLEAAHPTAVAGDFAFVDDGLNVLVYRWNALSEPAAWELSPGESTEVTPAQVKQLYEDNPDTNPLTNALLTLLVSFDGRFGWKRRGTWNASTNTPDLQNGTGVEGDYYVVTTPDTRSFGSLTYHFQMYDWVFFSGGVWQRLATNHITKWEEIEDKPVVIAAGATAEDARNSIDAVASTTKGQANGVMPLDAGGLAPLENIPDLSSLYTPKRTLIYQRTFTEVDQQQSQQIGDGYEQFNSIEIELEDITPSSGALGFQLEVRNTGGIWRTAGYYGHTFGLGGTDTLSQTVMTIVPQSAGTVSFSGLITLRKGRLPCVGYAVYADKYRDSRARLPVEDFSSARVYFGQLASGGSIIGGTIRVYGVRN